MNLSFDEIHARVNSFHDTANTVATVIYMHTLKPAYAVIWSGIWNLIGVLTSSGLVAFGVVALLPVELVLNGGESVRLAGRHAAEYSPRLGFDAAGLRASRGGNLLGIALRCSSRVRPAIMAANVAEQ